MEIEFFKYHGTGNDFILVDDRNKLFPREKSLINAMCDRHFGIGADGLILLSDKEGFDFDMAYYNSDGNVSTMCGNGGRCLVAFADYLALIGKDCRFHAMDGEHSATILGKNSTTWQVRLKMRDVKAYSELSDGYAINTGSPHLVIFRDDIHELDIVKEGRGIRYSEPYRAEGINVNFVEFKKNGLHVRTYERGVEYETLSCGTGVTASSLIYAARTGQDSGTVEVSTLGGKLEVSFSRDGENFTDIWLSGPAEMAFRGIYRLNE